MPAKRTTPTLGLPYRCAAQTDVRQTWAAATEARRTAWHHTHGSQAPSQPAQQAHKGPATGEQDH